MVETQPSALAKVYFVFILCGFRGHYNEYLCIQYLLKVCHVQGHPIFWKLAYTSKHIIIILHTIFMNSNEGIREEFKAEVTKLLREGTFRLGVKKNLLVSGENECHNT